MALDWDNIIVEDDENSQTQDTPVTILASGTPGSPISWDKLIIEEEETTVEGEDESVMIFASGIPGHSATIDEVTAETLPEGSEATVENVGTSSNARFHFGIPKGDQGEQGIQGEKGDKGDKGDAGIGSAEYDAENERVIFNGVDDDEVYTKTETDTLLDAKATVITETASGSIVSISDGAPLPVADLKVSIEPVQDLHGYDNPWPAGGGKNLISDVPNTDNGYLSNRYISSNGSITNSTAYYVCEYCPCEPDTIYTCRKYTSAAAVSVAICFYDSNKQYISGEAYNSRSSFEITTPSNAAFFRTVQDSPTENNPRRFLVSKGTTTPNIWEPYSNICPISGHTSVTVKRTGKNAYPILINQDYFKSNSSGSFTRNDDGSITVNCKDNTSNSGIYATTSLSSCVMAKTYAELRKHNTDVVISFMVYANQTARIKIQAGSSNIFDVSATPIKLSLVNALPTFYVPTNTYTNLTFTIYDVQLELGSSATAYEPYQGQQVTIDLDGTRYGGVLDVLTGEMTVDRVIFERNTSTMNNSESYPGWRNSGLKQYYGNGVNSTIYGAISNIFGLVDSGHKYCSFNSTNDTVYLAKALFNNKTQTEWIAEAVNVQIVCPLVIGSSIDARFTVQITPSQMQTLFGQNHLWSDTGDTEATYRADTKLYIQKLTKPTEDDMIANTNIAANTFFMVGNSLYFATSAIATGTSIVPGSNCTALSLADALNNLNA